MTSIEFIRSQSKTPEEFESALERELAKWHVSCAISGERIVLTNLRYWDVEKQIAYARPELIPANQPRK